MNRLKNRDDNIFLVSTPGTNSTFITAFMAALLLVILLRTAWVGDDAYITMRTVDNFVNGHGPVFNLGERVQSYTHPLWMFLLSILYFFTRDAYWSLILSSITLTLLTAILIGQKVARTQIGAILALIALVLSKAFIDYSTSGLENSLSHLLITLFAIAYLSSVSPIKQVLAVCLMGAFIALNRLDLLLMLMPAILLTLAEAWRVTPYQRTKVVVVGLAGFAPLFFWIGFSLFYYGFLFPNTAYAKLNTGISESLLRIQGVEYFLDSVTLDPVTLLVIGLGIVTAVLSRNAKQIAIAIGIILYLGYIIQIGGDFMSGRFFTAPFLFAIMLLCITEISPEWDSLTQWSSLLIPLGIIVYMGLQSPYPPPFSSNNYRQGEGNKVISRNGIADERAYYFSTTGLVQSCRSCGALVPMHPWVGEGLAIRDDDNSAKVVKSIGFIGYFAGPEVHIVDKFALVDPLLARLPVENPVEWRIGHFKRSIPAGYRDTLESGINQIVDPDIAEFYDHLSVIIHGDLFDSRRLLEIWKMNTGQYDHLIVRD